MKLTKCKNCQQKQSFVKNDDFLFNTSIEKTKNYVHATFLNENNEILEEQNVIYNKNATNPQRITYSFIKDDFLYTFKGWDNSLKSLKHNTIFKPIYEIEDNYYVIKDSTIITTKTENIHYAILPSYIYNSKTKNKQMIDSVASMTFNYVSGLRLVYIPQTIKNMGDCAFVGCKSALLFLEKEASKKWNRLNWGSKKYYAEIASCMVCKCYSNIKFENLIFKDDVIYMIINKKAHLLLIVDLNRINSLENYILVDNKKYFVTAIEEGAFANITLDDFVLSNKIKYIDKKAFLYCTFVNCNVYDNGYYIGNKNNPYLMLVKPVSTKIEQCILHPNVKFIKYQVFKDCHKLKNVKVPSNAVVDTEEIAHLIKD